MKFRSKSIFAYFQGCLFRAAKKLSELYWEGGVILLGVRSKISTASDCISTDGSYIACKRFRRLSAPIAGGKWEVPTAKNDAEVEIYLSEISRYKLLKQEEE